MTQKKMTKQLTAKRDDTPLHKAARSGNLDAASEILGGKSESEFKELLSKQNNSGETALFVAAENGYVDFVREIVRHYDLLTASIKARNGFDAFHIAAKQGGLDILKVLLGALPDLALTTDASNTTALHTAASQGHIGVVNLLLESGRSLAGIAKSNGKTLLHSAARNGHLEVVKAVLGCVEPGFLARQDKKKQTALHMAVKGQNLEVVEELIKTDPSALNIVDAKGNTPLHIATRKGRIEILRLLLSYDEIHKMAVNKAGETVLDIAEKEKNPSIISLLHEHNVQTAKSIKPQQNPVRELNQTVSDIKHEVHHQLEHTRETGRHVHGIAQRVHKLHAAGLNNAINSTTVVAVLIATVAFAAIFTVPGQFVDDPKEIRAGSSPGAANISGQTPFVVFVLFDSVALFISLAVVVVQTSIVVVESRAKRNMMAIINKLMWLACALISVAFLALSFVVVGEKERWLAIGVTIMGGLIMVMTIGTMCFWVVRHRMRAKDRRSIRRSSFESRRSSVLEAGDSDDLDKYNRMYAI